MNKFLLWLNLYKLNIPYVKRVDMKEVLVFSAAVLHALHSCSVTSETHNLVYLSIAVWIVIPNIHGSELQKTPKQQ